MAVKFIPRGDRYLVTVIEQDKMLMGFDLPDSSKDDMKAGIVVASSPTVYKTGTNEVIRQSHYQPGDRVLFGPWAGKEIQLEGVPFRVIKEEEIDGRIVNDDAGTTTKSS